VSTTTDAGMHEATAGHPIPVTLNRDPQSAVALRMPRRSRRVRRLRYHMVLPTPIRLPLSSQLVNPVCDRFRGWFPGRLCRQPTWPGRPMKSSSAWLTSSAWVQMIACGPPAMMVKRAFFSRAGSLRLVAS